MLALKPRSASERIVIGFEAGASNWDFCTKAVQAIAAPTAHRAIVFMFVVLFLMIWSMSAEGFVAILLDCAESQASGQRALN